MEIRRRFHELNNALQHFFLRIDRIEQWGISTGDELAGFEAHLQQVVSSTSLADSELNNRITTVDSASVERTNELERTISRRTIGFLISLFFVIVPILVGMLYKILDLITLLGRSPA